MMGKFGVFCLVTSQVWSLIGLATASCPIELLAPLGSPELVLAENAAKGGLDRPVISPDGSRVVFAGEDGGLYVWSVDEKQARPLVGGRLGWNVRVAFSPDMEKLFGAGTDFRIQWRSDHLSLDAQAPIANGILPMPSVPFRGRYAIYRTAEEPNRVISVDMIGNALDSRFQARHDVDGSVSPSGRYFVYLSPDGDLQVRDLESGQVVREVSRQSLPKDIKQVQFGPDDQSFVFRSGDPNRGLIIVGDDFFFSKSSNEADRVFWTQTTLKGHRILGHGNSERELVKNISIVGNKDERLRIIESNMNTKWAVSPDGTHLLGHFKRHPNPRTHNLPLVIFDIETLEPRWELDAPFLRSREIRKGFVFGQTSQLAGSDSFRVWKIPEAESTTSDSAHRFEASVGKLTVERTIDDKTIKVRVMKREP